MSKKNSNRGGAPSLISDAQAFRRQLHALGNVGKGLNAYRSHLSPGATAAIVQQLFQVSAYAGAFVANGFPQKFEDIKPRRALAPAYPELDLIWNASILSCFKQQINAYLLLRDKFYEFIGGGKFEDAEITLSEIESRFGVSTWLLFSKLLLVQLSSGISAQKSYLQEVIDRPGINGFFAYLAFFYSFGLEDNVSVAELNRELAQLSDAGAQEDVIAYFRYHASPGGLSAVDNPYNCITLEENSPIIDRFETFVEMSQLITVRSSDPSEVPKLKEALKLLDGISDLRLKNLQTTLGISVPTQTDPDFITACEAYTIGRYPEAQDLCRYALTQTPAAAWWYDLASRLGEACLPSAQDASQGLATQIVEGFQDAARLITPASSPKSKLQKLALLARKQPAALCIASRIDHQKEVSVSDAYSENQALWTIASPLENPKHFPILATITPELLALSTELSAPSAPNCSALHLSLLDSLENGCSIIDALNIPPYRKEQYLGHAHFKLSQYADAVVHYRSYAEHDDESRFRAARSVYECMRAMDDPDAAAIFIVDECFNNPESATLFPLEDACKWISESSGVDEFSIYRAILFNIATIRGLYKLEGDVSDSFEDTLDHFESIKPSDLLNRGDHDQYLTAFLRDVCTVSRIEDSIRFESVDEIENERISLLQWLISRSIDKSAIAHMKAEISSIVKDQEIARLIVKFDRSRIYVNETGVRKIVDPELIDAVSRYKQLLNEPDLEYQVEGIEQSLKKLLKSSSLDLAGLHLPTTERDGLFRNIYSVALNAFALSPAHGFQTYLSTRILHGSLEGELRSSFAQRRLLTVNDPVEGIAQLNGSWRASLSDLDDATFTRCMKVVQRFSDKFINDLATIKKDVIRVRSKDALSGVFAFESTDDEYTTVRNSLANDTSYEEFVSRLFSHFWDLAEHDLGNARQVISSFGKTVEDAVAKAVSAIEAICTNGTAELRDSFTHALTGFLADAQRVSSWFYRSGILPEEPFTIEIATGVAVKISNNCYPAFPIAPSIVDQVGNVEGGHLNAVVDLLANCLLNAVQHSGITERAPSIDVTAEATTDGFILAVSSELSEESDIDCVQDRLDQKLQDDPDGADVMTEGGSGLRKMRRILRHDIRTKVSLEAYVSVEHRVIISMFIPQERGGALEASPN